MAIVGLVRQGLWWGLLLGDSAGCASALAAAGVLLGGDGRSALRIRPPPPNARASSSDPVPGSAETDRSGIRPGLRARPRSALHASSASDWFGTDERRSTKLTINLLSFDGGGVMGALSTRMLAYTLQYVLSGQQQQQQQQQETKADKKAAASAKGLGKSWRRRLFKYVDAFVPCYDVLWTSFAQKLDSAGIAPQEEGIGKWMDYNWASPAHSEMMRSVVRIDLAYDFYLAHVLYVLVRILVGTIVSILSFSAHRFLHSFQNTRFRAISGTSTGGILAASTMLRMSLMQLVALYADPKVTQTIFPPRFDLTRPGAGLWQAKYTQKGVSSVTDRVVRWSAPGLSPSDPDPHVHFVEAARTFNECIKARILGRALHPAELERIRSTLLAAAHGSSSAAASKEAVQDQLDRYGACVRDASQFLDLAKVKRFKKLNSVDNDRDGCLSNLEIREPSVSYDDEYFATRFLITSRCLNNDAAVVFDSHEPIEDDDQEMNARGELRLANGLSLNVRDMALKDVVMATTAAPYYFPAHQVDAKKGGRTKFYFHDGGVMANDPGLINACFAYQHFTPSTRAGSDFYFPVLRVLRLGCGLQASVPGNPISPVTLQGGTIVAQLPKIFMSADSSRTNLLAKVGTVWDCAHSLLVVFCRSGSDPLRSLDSTFRS
jgi:Patatin-like phospholipase